MLYIYFWFQELGKCKFGSALELVLPHAMHFNQVVSEFMEFIVPKNNQSLVPVHHCRAVGTGGREGDRPLPPDFSWNRSKTCSIQWSSINYCLPSSFQNPSYGPAVPPAHCSQPHTDNQLLALFRDVLYWNLFFNWSHPLIQLGLEFHNFYCTSRLNYFYSIEFRMLLILFLVKSNPLVRW